jgi:hypothetical protein
LRPHGLILGPRRGPFKWQPVYPLHASFTIASIRDPRVAGTLNEEDPHPSFVHELPLTREALEFAKDRHAGQRRAADDASFVLHPLEVASLLDRSNYPDFVVAAAVLHDVLEETDAQRSELDERFGRPVGELVAAVSDDPGIEDEEERKKELRERIRHVGGYAAAVFAADKISKVREVRTLLARGVPRAEVQPKIDRHRSEMLEQTIPNSRLVRGLRFELEVLDELPPAGGGQDRVD